MKTKWILILSVLGLGLAALGIFYSKQMTANYGKADIDKTLSVLEKYKVMQNEGAFDFQFTELQPGLNEVRATENETASKNSRAVVKLSDLNGSLILLNFWASWCEPCIQEFPDMIGLIEKRPNIKVVAINRDQNKEDAIRFIESFPEAKGKILFYWDPKGEVTSLYGTEVLPESYLIGTNFKVLKKVVGIEDWDRPSILQYLDSL